MKKTIQIGKIKFIDHPMFLVGINSFLYGLKINFIPYAARSAAARFIALPLILITILFCFVFNRVQSKLSHTECCWNQSFFVHQPTAGRTGGHFYHGKIIKKVPKKTGYLPYRWRKSSTLPSPPSAMSIWSISQYEKWDCTMTSQIYPEDCSFKRIRKNNNFSNITLFFSLYFWYRQFKWKVRNSNLK